MSYRHRFVTILEEVLENSQVPDACGPDRAPVLFEITFICWLVLIGRSLHAERNSVLLGVQISSAVVYQPAANELDVDQIGLQ